MALRAQLIGAAVLLAIACDGTTHQDAANQGSELYQSSRGDKLWKVGGKTRGLAGTGLVLALDGIHELSVNSNGQFYFDQRLPTGAPYSVTLKSQPVSVVQTCAVSNGDGIVGAENVKSVEVTCSPTGAFAETGGLTVAPRYNHSATLLPDGKVLIAGGDPDLADMWAEATASAELYHPATGTFAPTGSMGMGRFGQSATLLPSGKVLIAGGAPYWGWFGYAASPTAELYDPTTGLFTPTGTMNVPRYGHTATLLPSGKVLMTSGFEYDVATRITAELYDPATGTFTLTGPPTATRYGHTAVLLEDGTVLVLGGTGSFWNPVTTFADLYDPATGTFTRLGDVPMGVESAALLPDGRVLAVGIPTSSGGPYALLYDPATRQFSAATASADPLPSSTATLLRNGAVLLTGWDSCAVFDSATGLFAPTGCLHAPQGLQKATLLRDGDVLVTGSLGTSTLPEVYRIIPPLN